MAQEDRESIEPCDDGLFIGEVGPWAKDKYYFLDRYLRAFTIAMRQKWVGKLHYVDLFAGPGFHRIRNTDTVIAGSPVIAANVPYPFGRFIVAILTFERSTRWSRGSRRQGWTTNRES